MCKHGNDSEVLEAAKAFRVEGWTIDNFQTEWTMSDLMARFAIEYAAKHLESQRAEIERKAVEKAFADVKTAAIGISKGLRRP